MSSGAKQKRSSIDAGSSCAGITSGSKRLRKTSTCEDEDSRLSSSKAVLPPLPLPPMSKIYNSSYRSNKPAELFRKDLISAMKLPDSEPLDSDDYWFISDGWKQEWERGVQVPVNPGHLPEPGVKVIKKKSKSNDFKLPPNKYLRLSHDEFFSNELHVLTNVSALAEKTCRYDLDSLDQQWLRVFNDERKSHGLEPLPELTMEMILEDFENQCYEKLQREIRTEQGLGIEYDEDVVCDVCRSPDSEEGNEMVFCDQCDLCVHQACYGIQRIPEGSWVCRTCALGIRPPCLLCPTRGGAMKSTRSGQKWAHVSCALWIPEVSIGCVEKMEPIMKISQIPPSRWALTCCLCRERIGACIQCSVKACKRAYHVTCAFENGLEMKAIIDDNPDDEVKLKSYCPKHSKKKEVHRKEASSDDSDKKASPVSREGHHQRDAEVSNEEKESARLAKIQAIEAEFYKHVSLKETAEAMSTDPVVVDFVFNFWKLKRKVRNLCYMVSRREKIAKSLLKIREEIFEHQVAMLKPGGPKMSEREREAVILAGQSEHVYDRLVSQDVSSPKPCLRLLLDALEGREVPNLYGLTKKPPSTPTRLPNPYAKQYVNGLRSRRLSMMGGAGESEGCVAQDEDSQGTADSATTVSGRGDAAADLSSTRPVQNAAAALETLSEEQLEASEEECGQSVGGGNNLSRGVAEAQLKANRSHRLESAEDTSSTSSRNEIRKEDPSDIEGRMSTRSRNAETVNEIGDTEGRMSTRSRNADTVNEISDNEGKMLTRSRNTDTVTEISDTEVRMSTRSRNADTANEISDTESRMSTRSRNADTVNEMRKEDLSDTEGRMFTRSRNADSVNEISDTEGRMFTRSRNADTVNEISDTESRMSTRSRNADTVNEIRKEDLSDTEGKMSTRSRNAVTVRNTVKEEVGTEDPTEVECKAQTRSRRLGSVDSVKSASKGETRKDEIGVVNSRTPLRSRRPERDQFTRSPSSIEKKDDLFDTGNRTPVRSRRLEASDSTPKGSPRGDTKENEQGDAGSKTPTRSRRYESLDDSVRSLVKSEMQQKGPMELECKAPYRSRRQEQKTEVDEQKTCLFRNEAERGESIDVGSRSSSRSRRCDTKLEPAQEAIRAFRTAEGQADEIEKVECKPPIRSRRLEVRNEVADEVARSASRHEAEKGETDGRVSMRSRRAEAVEACDHLCKVVLRKETIKDDTVEQENRSNFGRPTRLSEAKIELVPHEAREVSENQDAGDEIGVKGSSRSRRLRKRTTACSEEEEHPQLATLASLCEFPEELNDVGRCTRSSTMQKQENAQSLEGASSREPAEGRQGVTTANNYVKHTSDENVPKRPERRERRDSVACSALLPEALSPPRASLSGYRIPKKVKAPNGVLEDRRGSSPVSPLHEVPSHCYVGSDGYTRGRSHVVNVRRPVLGHHCEGRGGAYVERWKHDLDFGDPTGNSATSEWAGKQEVKENGSRYSMRYRPKFGGKDS
ncbi:PHD finger protein rhinoceros-like isoform X2 [Dermacentor silvarum]|uniref:PHD finger protein rhinoceros-like isoform X2 n=1 Tax=Dermacentor silvarum TaxID=543639 RepID=UPI001899036D|nr:PHD finger protein rhinoceros-like isoform X2 [Dermacentor silvarum]